MKSIFLRLISVVFVFIFLIWLAGYLLPRSYSIQSSVDIAAAPDKIFPLVNELPNWRDWSPWGAEGLEVQYSGEAAGVGSIQTWSDPRGDGKLYITDSQANEKVTYKMRSGGFPEMESSIELSSSDGNTSVTWSSEGELPNGAFYGFFALLFQSGMQAEYDRGLAKLKSVAERNATE